MKAFKVVFASQVRIFLRDRIDFFLTLGLPIVFILLFGFIWGGGERPTKLGLVLLGPEEPLLSLLRERADLAIVRLESPEDLSEAVKKRSVDFGLIWDGEKISFLFEASRVQDNPSYEQLARGVAAALELRLQGRESAVLPEKVHAGKLLQASWLHMVIPGIITIPILSAGLFAVASRVTSMRERRILAQLLVTPLSPAFLILGLGLVRILIAYLGAFVTLFLGALVFGVRFLIRWDLFLILVFASGLGGLGFGALIALLVRRPGSATFLANLFLQVMLFLSGIYFPLEFLPPFLRTVSQFLPLTHLAQGMRFALGVVEMGSFEFWGITGGFAFVGIFLVPLLARQATRSA
ncbi:ABC transporter permease [Candidatus Bipolaricaulota bacterium]|nr:ABC transporter permease [Candidatus Bipolaricaulota bacterium]